LAGLTGDNWLIAGAGLSGTIVAPDEVSNPGQDPDAALVARIAGRDQQAFAEFYASYRRRLARFLGRFLASPEVIDELINDVMFVVWQDAGRFELRSRVSTWVFGIAWHKALKALERQKRRRVLHDAIARLGPPPPDGNDPEKREWLRQGLDQLSPEQRLVVELTFYIGCSYGEVAEIAGCPVNTVKTRMFHARQKLRAVLVTLDGLGPEDKS
jgi:RNA polymerase sigma-70 factor, ECF subfamily